MKNQYETSGMHTEVKNHKMIGKVITEWMTGWEVQSTVTNVYEDKYSITLYTKLHEGVNYGGDIYETGQVTLRKCDNWIVGSDHVTVEDFLN